MSNSALIQNGRSLLRGIPACLLLCCACPLYAAPDTARVYFGFNSDRLSNREQERLDSLLYTGFFDGGRRLVIQGYTDYVGRGGYNDSLSFRRAAAVQDYLHAASAFRAEIRIVAGKGKIMRSPVPGRKGIPGDRVVALFAVSPEPVAGREQSAPAKESRQYRPHHQEFIRYITPDAPPGFIALAERHNREPDNEELHGGDEHPVRRNGVVQTPERVRAARKTALMAALATDVPSRRAGPGRGHNLMELAIVYALEGAGDSAVLQLHRALDACDAEDPRCDEVWDPNILGFYQFRSFRNTLEWQRLENRMLAAFRKQNKGIDYSLAITLIRAGGADQSVRIDRYNGMAAPAEELIKETDAANASLIKSIVSRYGFPKKSAVGAQAAGAAFLLVQHLTGDTAFQRRVLRQMAALLPAQEVEAEAYALLTDRLMVSTGGTQLYGTQFRIITDASGRVTARELYPVVDADRLNERRAQMHLPPLEER